MDDIIRDIFAAIDGATPSKPFASFTGAGSGGLVAVAAGILDGPDAKLPDGRYYVAYLLLEEGGQKTGTLGESGSTRRPPRRISYVGEDLRLHLTRERSAPKGRYAGGYGVRYLEAFDDAFEAGRVYEFFWNALHPRPEPDDPDERVEEDHRRGLERIEDFIEGRAARALHDEVLRAEEELATAKTTSAQRGFWEQARQTALEDLTDLVTDPEQRERDLALHRYRRAAEAAEAARRAGEAPDSEPPDGTDPRHDEG